MQKHSSQADKGLITCVRLSKETRDRLAQLGNKDQTFDDIINVTIDQSLEKDSCNNDLEENMSDEREERFS